MHRLISPFSKPNIQFATVMAHHISANLSYFCLFLDNDQVSQQAIFIKNLLVDKFVKPLLWAPLLYDPCCTASVLQITSAKKQWKTSGQQDCACSTHWPCCLSFCHLLLIVKWKFCRARPFHICAVSHTCPISSSPAVPKHHQSPADCAGVVMKDQDQPPFANKKK